MIKDSERILIVELLDSLKKRAGKETQPEDKIRELIRIAKAQSLVRDTNKQKQAVLTAYAKYLKDSYGEKMYDLFLKEVALTFNIRELGSEEIALAVNALKQSNYRRQIPEDWNRLWKEKKMDLI